MEFASIKFILCFLPATLFLFYFARVVTAGKAREYVCRILLLAASLAFYFLAGYKGFIVLIVSILINFFGGIIISKNNREKNKGTRILLLVILIVLNAGSLAFYKYFGIITGKSIVMPLAISFVTFQSIAYIVDVYKEKIKAEKNILYFALFVSFFGQMSQGPILRYDDFGAQIADKDSFLNKINFQDLGDGAKRFCYGLAKKVIVSNTVAEVCDHIWENPEGIGSPVAWFGILLYTLQIYFDFSGYSDMAVGIGKMFGLKIKENFDYPYTSLSIQEFWRRWHMTLGAWFKDYIYIPLGGSKRGTARTCLNLLIVFLVTGIWHGADLTFILWGLAFAIFSIIERVGFGKVLKKNPVKVLNWIYCTFIVMMAWVLFRAADLSQAIVYYKELFSFSSSTQHMTVVGLIDVDLIAAVVFGILFCGLLQRPLSKTYNKIKNSAAFMIIDTIVMIALLVWSILMIIEGSYTPSIYGNF